MKKNSQQGYIALIGVILLGSAILAALLGLSLVSTTSTKTIRSGIVSEKSYFLAMTCAEQALLNLWLDENYSGNEMLELNQGICGILAIEDSQEEKVIRTYGSSEGATRRMRLVAATTTPQILLSDWQDVGDF